MNTANESRGRTGSLWIRNSLFVKLASISLIVFLLMIPNALVKELIYERNQNQKGVVQEVSAKWGHKQQVVGPVLTIPYKLKFEDEEGNVSEYIKHSHFLPEHLSIKGNINPESRKRGLYDVVLYQSQLNCSGWFAKPDLSKFSVEEENFLWDKAFLQISIPDMAGINDNIKMEYDGQSYRMEPGIDKYNGFQSGVRLPVEIDTSKQELEFNFNLDLNGSHALTFGPIGKETIVQLESSWSSPSFMGSFLPDEHIVNESGFSASWKILDLNRNYPQSWLGDKHDLLQSTFGLELMQPVNEYAKNTRAAKYTLLVVSLTFLMFFFFEVINKQRVHPMHYILVGLAISIFYILLLSLSEHVGFNMAYILSTWAIVGLIGTYSTSILNSKKLVVIQGIMLLSIFGFIFVILQLEDYALLAGSVGLLLVLAVVMYFSRNIDWSNFSKASMKAAEVPDFDI